MPQQGWLQVFQPVLRTLLVTALVFGILALNSGESAAFSSCGNRTDTELVSDLSVMHGFARMAGTTGGSGRTVFRVTSTDDDPGAPGVGTLRHAVEQARRSSGGTVLFDLPCDRDSTIMLRKQIMLPGNLTVDGGGGRVRIGAAMDETLFRIGAVENVIIRRLGFFKEPTCLVVKSGAGRCSRQADIITVLQGADRLWIAENEFRECGDGCVDVMFREPGARPTRMTISFNQFQNHNKVMLVGILGCAAERAGSPLCQLSGAGPLISLTIERNLFLNTAQRHPRTSGAVYIHSVGNAGFLRPYHASAQTVESGVFGIASLAGGRVLSEGDFFTAEGAQMPIRGTFGELWRSANAVEPVSKEPGGAIRLRNSFGTSNVGMLDREPGQVQDPPYSDVPLPRNSNAAVAAKYAYCLRAAFQGVDRAAAALRCNGG